MTSTLTSIQAGTSTNPTSVQNATYQYDLMGNVTQRQDGKRSLTENYAYGSGADNLYRLASASVLGGSTVSWTYDLISNIKSKSDVASGATWTYDATRPHRLLQAGSAANSYGYDANGNVTSRNGSTLTWTSYNYPSGLASGTESAPIAYGPNRQKWKLAFTSGSTTTNTYYIGGMMEKVVGTGTTYRHCIYNGAEAIAMYRRGSDGGVIQRYLLSDHQGSLDTIMRDASVEVSESFTPFGERRNASTWSGAPTNQATLDAITRQGYTFQMALGAMGLNHMNGRVQDAVTGRFLSADPYVTEPGNSQNWNRYAYVYNNPATNVDPSGFDADDDDDDDSSCSGAGSACAGAAEDEARRAIEEMIVNGRCGLLCQDASLRRLIDSFIIDYLARQNLFPTPVAGSSSSASGGDSPQTQCRAVPTSSSERASALSGDFTSYYQIARIAR